VSCRAARFDLVVRTEAPLAAALPDAIRVLVQAASEVAGVTGKAGLSRRRAPRPDRVAPRDAPPGHLLSGAGGRSGRGRRNLGAPPGIRRRPRRAGGS
jgi:hypothetical protein